MVTVTREISWPSMSPQGNAFHSLQALLAPLPLITVDNPQSFPLPFIPQILSTQLSVFPQAHPTPAHFYGIYSFILTPHTFIRTDFSIGKTQSLLIMTFLGVWVSGEPIFHDLSQAVRDWSVNIEQKVNKHNREREARDETTVGT